MPDPIPADSVLDYTWSLHTQDYTFRKGHRIMIQVQSSWFPMVDLNPGTFMHLYEAKPSDFHKTTQRVYHSAAHPSYVELTVLP